MRKKQLNIFQKTSNCRQREIFYIYFKQKVDMLGIDTFQYHTRPLRLSTQLQLKLNNINSNKRALESTATMQGCNSRARRSTHHPEEKAIHFVLPGQSVAMAHQPTTNALDNNTTACVTNICVNPRNDPILINYIQSASSLNFQAVPRPDIRIDGANREPIPIRSEKSFHSSMKWHVIAVATSFGYQSMSAKNREILGKAILHRESYLAGFQSPPSHHSLLRWWNLYQKAKWNSVRIDDVFKSKRGESRTTYAAYLQKKFPTLLHLLYRYATQVLGIDATTASIIDIMNSKSLIDHPHCPIRQTLRLNKFHFWNFFYSNNGCLKAPITRPTLTAEHKIERVEFSGVWLDKVEMNKLGKFSKIYYCFLDEKWIYTTSRRKKLKILPPAPFENPEDVRVTNPKVRSRRHPCKIMFMGIVAPPEPAHDFDGKIMLRRICKWKQQAKWSYHSKFSDCPIVNYMIRSNHWHQLILSTTDPSFPNLTSISIAEVSFWMEDAYGLDADVTDALVFSYKNFIKDSTSKTPFKWIRLTQQDGYLLHRRSIRPAVDAELRPLAITDIKVEVGVPSGTPVQKDISCDSDFMLDIIHEAGRAIRSSFSFVPPSTTIYLFMDNAGGHGKDEVKKKYVRKLKTIYNIEVVWQVPNSPETNLLDLGIWCSFQSLVEKVHNKKCSNADALNRTIEKAWDMFDGSAKLAKVAERWELVLKLIVEDNGGNNLVETCRNIKEKLGFTKKELELINRSIENDDNNNHIVPQDPHYYNSDEEFIDDFEIDDN